MMQLCTHKNRDIGLDDNAPKSKNWRNAWRSFCSRYQNLPPSEELRQLRIDHHEGWRSGVGHVRDGRKGYPRSIAIIEMPRDRIRAWEHGALCGTRSAREYLQESGIDRRKLK